MDFDIFFFNKIYALTQKYSFLREIAIFFAKYFEYFLIFVLLLFLFKNFKKYWSMVIYGLISAIFARFFITTLIRMIWFRPRPFALLNIKPLFDYEPNVASFPSGHASFYFALSTIIYHYNKKAGILFFVASFLISLARIFSGIHWLSDILMGAMIGVLSGWLIIFFIRHFFKVARNNHHN